MMNTYPGVPIERVNPFDQFPVSDANNTYSQNAHPVHNVHSNHIHTQEQYHSMNTQTNTGQAPGAIQNNSPYPYPQAQYNQSNTYASIPHDTWIPNSQSLPTAQHYGNHMSPSQVQNYNNNTHQHQYDLNNKNFYEDNLKPSKDSSPRSVIGKSWYAPPSALSMNDRFQAHYKQGRSSLPDLNLIKHSGNILGRISTRSLVTKKWRNLFYITYGDSLLFVFRSRQDFEEWSTKLHLDTPARDRLIKLKVDFINDVKPPTLGYEATRVRLKKYGNNMLHSFKLEKWQTYGPGIFAAFASLEPDPVTTLRSCISEMISTSPRQKIHFMKDPNYKHHQDSHSVGSRSTNPYDDGSRSGRSWHSGLSTNSGLSRFTTKTDPGIKSSSNQHRNKSKGGSFDMSSLYSSLKNMSSNRSTGQIKERSNSINGKTISQYQVRLFSPLKNMSSNRSTGQIKERSNNAVHINGRNTSPYQDPNYWAPAQYY